MSEQKTPGFYNYCAFWKRDPDSEKSERQWRAMVPDAKSRWKSGAIASHKAVEEQRLQKTTRQCDKCNVTLQIFTADLDICPACGKQFDGQ